MEVYTCDSVSYVICRNLAFLMLDLETSTVMAAEAIIVVSDIYREDLLPQGGYGPFNPPAHRFSLLLYTIH